MAESLKLEIRSTLPALAVAAETAARWLQAHDVPPAAGAMAQLGLEELVTNCIKYGYDDGREHVIRVSVTISDTHLALRVVDDGHPFNPIEALAPDLSQPLEKRTVGGLGLHLLRTMSDRMDYERRDGFNHVTLEKALV